MCFLKDIGEKAKSSWMGFLSVGHRKLSATWNQDWAQNISFMVDWSLGLPVELATNLSGGNC